MKRPALEERQVRPSQGGPLVVPGVAESGPRWIGRLLHEVEMDRLPLGVAYAHPVQDPLKGLEPPVDGLALFNSDFRGPR